MNAVQAGAELFAAFPRPVSYARLSRFLIQNMHRTKQIGVVGVIAVVAILGTFAINGLVLQWADGETISNGYLLMLVDSVLYAAWFLALASAGTLFLKPRPFFALGIAAFAVFCYLISFSIVAWIDPEVSLLQRALAYFQVYVASFMVVPAFLLVGFIVQQRS